MNREKGGYMEQYHIALSPDLGLSPADFVAAWNEDAQARTNGETQLADATGKEYYAAALANEIILSLTTGIAGNALYDLIKAVLLKKGVHKKHTHIQETKKRGGTRLLIIDVDEE
jgi:hypothetical protein